MLCILFNYKKIMSGTTILPPNALCQAAADGDLAQFIKLIGEGAIVAPASIYPIETDEIKIIDAENLPAYWAVKNGHLNIINYLLTNDPAALNYELSISNELANNDKSDELFEPRLAEVAAFHHQNDIAKVLFDQFPDQLCSLYTLNLSTAVAYTNNLGMFQYLVNKNLNYILSEQAPETTARAGAGGPLLEATDYSGQPENNALIPCIVNNRPEMLKFALKAGLDPNWGATPHNEGQSPLIAAITEHNSEMVELLLSYGADPDLLSAEQDDTAKQYLEAEFWVNRDMDPKKKNDFKVECQKLFEMDISVLRKRREAPKVLSLFKAASDQNYSELEEYKRLRLHDEAKPTEEKYGKHAMAVYQFMQRNRCSRFGHPDTKKESAMANLTAEKIAGFLI